MMSSKKRGEPKVGRGITLVPIGTRCLVLKHKEEATAGGIIIPKDAQTNAQMGEVIATGDQCDYVKPGDKVFFGPYSGRSIAADVDTSNTIHFQDIWVMVEDDILCKVLEKR